MSKNSVAKSVWLKLNNSFDIPSTTKSKSKSTFKHCKHRDIPSRYHKKTPQSQYKEGIDFAALRRLFESQYKVSK